ncbi:MAG: DUF6894 family protein [Phenylobacterium sp.]|jgi:hypothetical protein
MAQFYFHTEDGRSVSDDEGTDLATLADARVEAVRVLGDILRENPDEVLATGQLRLTVTNAAGLIYFALDLSATDAAAGKAQRSGG